MRMDSRASFWNGRHKIPKDTAQKRRRPASSMRQNVCFSYSVSAVQVSVE